MIYLTIVTLTCSAPMRVGRLIGAGGDELLLFAESLQQLIGELRLAPFPLKRVGQLCVQVAYHDSS